MHSIRLVLASLFVCSCAATPNPERSSTPAQMTIAKPQQSAATPANAPETKSAVPSTPSTGTAGTTSAASPSLVVATVGSSTIDVTELLTQWMHRDSRQVREELDHLVMDRLVLAEARRLGVEVAPDEVEKAYAQAADAIEKEIQKKRAGLTLDRYIVQVLGLDARNYRERLRDDTLRRELASRVIRGWVLSSEHANIRVIVVKDEAKLKEVQDALAAGTPFDEVARKHSAEASAEDGGRVPPVVRSDTTMGRLAFTTDVGAVGGPKYEQGAWLLIRVDSRPTPLTGTWPDIRAAVEKSLSERGVEDLELSQWQASMLERYDVDITPLLRMVGEPAKPTRP